ncbi:MAG: phosphoglycerate kinase, partial [Proteobacteria bacterium]|nr:phosphoglycerate kinase [Pseudomonadota bacterium]
LYVNDAFGSAHRCHSSTYGLPELVGSGKRAAGFLIEKELRYLGEALKNPARPFVAILGGVKVSDKIEVSHNLLNNVDNLLIGGAMSYTFMKALGKQVGDSLVEKDKIDLAKQLLDQGKAKLRLPVDTICGKELKEGTETQIGRGQIQPGWQGLDIGPETIKKYTALIKQARTIVWNGPVGVFEFDQFGEGTKTLAQAIASSSAFSIAGGGDTLAAADKYGVSAQISYISTGGGAFLEFLEGKSLPAVAMLEQRKGN